MLSPAPGGFVFAAYVAVAALVGADRVAEEEHDPVAEHQRLSQVGAEHAEAAQRLSARGRGEVHAVHLNLKVLAGQLHAWRRAARDKLDVLRK